MKGKKHKPEQIIKKLREADAMIAAVKPLVRKRVSPSNGTRRASLGS